MATAANYVIIEGDITRFLGDGVTDYEKTFDTPDYNGGDAVLSLMVQGLTAATSTVEVELNGLKIGDIFPYRYASESDRDEVSTHWFTQTMIAGSNVLEAQSPNTLRLTAVDYPENTPPTDVYDNMAVRGIVLSYKVEV